MIDIWPPIPADDPPETRKRGEPHHVGLIISQRRAIAVATALFADEVTDNSNCKAEVGRAGLPCSVCEYRNKQWADRVRQVRLAMMEAFK